MRGHVDGDSGKATLSDPLLCTFFLILFSFPLPQLFLSLGWKAILLLPKFTNPGVIFILIAFRK